MTPPDKPATLVLGGGLMGLAVAHQLARHGENVTVISRRRSEAAGFVAAGMLAPHAEGLSGDLLKLGQASLERIPRWVAQIEGDSGLSCGLRTSGIVVPFRTAAERDAYPTASLGQTLGRTALEREIPGLGPAWSTGLLFEQDGQIDNRRQLMRALERACVSLGVQFMEGAEVLDLERESAGQLCGIHLRSAEGEQQQLRCQQAVLCSGAWSQQLVPQLPVFPVKGQMLSLQGPREALKRVIFGPGTYLVPREDGLIVVGPPANGTPDLLKGSRPMARNNCRRASPACCQQRPTGLRWSVGGGSGPAHPMKAPCSALVRYLASGWPVDITAMAFCLPPSRLSSRPAAS